MSDGRNMLPLAQVTWTAF